MSIELLNELNAFRAGDDKPPFKDWRKARHMPMLEEYCINDEIASVGEADLGDDFEMPEEELAAQVGRESADIARDEALVAHVETVTPVKGGVVINTSAVAYKLMPIKDSTVENPFKVVHSFLDANPTLKRKDAVARLVEMGVNYYTARTQYQRWFTKRKG